MKNGVGKSLWSNHCVDHITTHLFSCLVVQEIVNSCSYVIGNAYCHPMSTVRCVPRALQGAVSTYSSCCGNHYGATEEMGGVFSH